MITPVSKTDDAVDERSHFLFTEHWQQILRQTDKMFACLMLFQWVAAIGAALWLSPRTWIGGVSQTHFHVWAAIFFGGAITLFPVWLAWKHSGETATRHSIAVGQMMMTGLLIHLMGGRIETHFHVFGSLAFLSFYRDWRVLITATVVTAGDHLVRGLLFPASIFGTATGETWRWLEHAGWVIFEDIFLIIRCHWGIRELHGLCERDAQLEFSNAGLERKVQARTASLREANARLEAHAAAMSGTVEAFAGLVEARDAYTSEHTDGVQSLSLQIAQRLGMSEDEIWTVGLVAKLHDIGKVAIPDAVLRKPGKLTEEEWVLMKQHPIIGADVVSRIPTLQAAAPGIRGHHERWDGNGYPDGLAGDRIPLAARIITVADSYNAMTTTRPYRTARSHAEAMQELRAGCGSQFDPQIIAAVERLFDQPVELLKAA
jgi:hypothetical protein